MSIKVFSLAILASLLCLSCSETTTDYESSASTTTSTKALTTYDVDIEASTETPSNQPATRANMPFKVSEENISGKTVLYPKLNITQQTMPSLVVLYYKTRGTKEVVEANWTVSKEGSTIKLLLNKLSTQNNLANGEWYIMAFMGGGEKKGDDLEVNTETTINVIEKGKEFTTSCPFATTWRRIVKQGSKLKLNDESKKMVFKPQGVFLVLSLENRMTLPTKINRNITMESNAFCASGEYKFNIDRNNVSDDADKAASYWEPNRANAISRSSSIYEKYNARHYTTNITLKYDGTKNDGTLRNGQSDLNSHIYFNSYNKSTGTNTPNTRTSRGFLLCLMPVDYKKTSDYPGGIVNETLLFGDVEVADANRTNFTYDKNTYTKNPSTWRPYMGRRFLLGSFSDELAKGSSYNMTLRIIRPTLFIERLWAYRQGNELQKKQEAEAEQIAEGKKTDNYYPSLNSGNYRLTKFSEFTPIFNNPKLQLDQGKGFQGANAMNIGPEYGYILTMGNNLDFADLNGKQKKFDNWFCTVSGSRVIYGIMCFKPFGNRDATSTNNYKVAVRMTFPNPRATSGVAKVETYYLGPNYNLSLNVAGYYLCHDEFWKRLDSRDIITREFPLDTYWLTTKYMIQSNEPRPRITKFTTDGVSQDKLTVGRGRPTYYFLPWLRKPAW